MAEMLPFGYAGFYDVPRFMVLRFRGVTLVLRSPFDESLDEYPDTYSVHQVPRAIVPRRAFCMRIEVVSESPATLK